MNNSGHDFLSGLKMGAAFCAMVFCCVGLLLLAGGAFSGYFAWLSDGGAVTIGLAAIAGALGVYLYKTKVARGRENHPVNATSRDS